MATIEEYKEAYQRKKQQLDSILELTRAINNNVSEEALYRIYNFILIFQTKVKKHLLILENGEIRSNIGIKDEEQFEAAYAEHGANGKLFKDSFSIHVEVHHEDRTLAHVFLKFESLLDKKEQLSFVKTISNIVLVAISNKQYIQQQIEKEAYEKELNIARNVQHMLFPAALPKEQRLEMHASYIPHRVIGGDYYDYIKKSDTEYVICIADVAGKGVPAAILMSNFQATLRTLVRQNLNLREITSELNTVAFSNTKGEKFITAFIALLDLKRETLYYINAGHNPPYYVDRDHHVESLRTGTTLLGAFEELPKVEIGKIKLVDYSLLFSFTDGLVEVFDKEGNQFDEEELEKFLRTEQTQSLEEFHEELLTRIKQFSKGGEYHDDITLLSCKFTF